MFFSQEEAAGIGKDKMSGQYCLFFGVFNGLVQYTEYYILSVEEYEKFRANFSEARDLVARCKDHKEDHRLLRKPGRLRGSPV